jgi:hypothetical protein
MGNVYINFNLGISSKNKRTKYIANNKFIT